MIGRNRSRKSTYLSSFLKEITGQPPQDVKPTESPTIGAWNGPDSPPCLPESITWVEAQAEINQGISRRNEAGRKKRPVLRRLRAPYWIRL